MTPMLKSFWHLVLRIFASVLAFTHLPVCAVVCSSHTVQFKQYSLSD
jgi:hypothetical protein